MTTNATRDAQRCTLTQAMHHSCPGRSAGLATVPGLTILRQMPRLTRPQTNRRDLGRRTWAHDHLAF